MWRMGYCDLMGGVTQQRIFIFVGLVVQWWDIGFDSGFCFLCARVSDYHGGGIYGSVVLGFCRISVWHLGWKV